MHSKIYKINSEVGLLLRVRLTDFVHVSSEHEESEENMFFPIKFDHSDRSARIGNSHQGVPQCDAVEPFRLA